MKLSNRREFAFLSVLSLVLLPQASAVAQPPKKSPPVSALSAAIERFRALEPAERLKLVERLAGEKSPFNATAKGDLVVSIVERGSIEPVNAPELVCKVKQKKDAASATVIKWVIDDGSIVKKGDRLLTLDDSALRDQLKSAMLKTQEADAAKLKATESVGLVQRENEIEVKLAEIALRFAEIELKDSKDEKAKPVLELKIEAAKLLLEKAKARAKAQQVQAEADKQARTTAWELTVRRQREIETELKHCELTAPADGLVVYYVPESTRFSAIGALIAPGEPVREGQKLLRIIDLQKLAIGTRVAESMISTVRAGQTTQVRVDAYPDRVLSGKVAQVATVASPADFRTSDVKVYAVTISLDDAPNGLKPGMSAQVQIASGERKGVLQMPLKSILVVGRDRICFVKIGQELIERKVSLGASNSMTIEIKEGLKEGEQVLADPTAFLGKP